MAQYKSSFDREAIPVAVPNMMIGWRNRFTQSSCVAEYVEVDPGSERTNPKSSVPEESGCKSMGDYNMRTDSRCQGVGR
jgi:hypothetical protein